MAKAIIMPTITLVSGPTMDAIDMIYCMAKKSVNLNKSTFDSEFLNKVTREERIKFVTDLLFEVGHIGSADHPTYSFEVEGTNRAHNHQAVRNRIAAFLECSLRYINPIKNGNYHYVVPFNLRNHPDLMDEYQKDMEHCEAVYAKWYNIAREQLKLPDSKAKELARTTLPLASASGYSFTMSASSLIRLFNKRLCVRAEEPFREAAGMMLDEVRKVTPEIFNLVGAHCEQYGYCPEGKYSCGRYPTLRELRNDYKGFKLSGALLDGVAK